MSTCRTVVIVLLLYMVLNSVFNYNVCHRWKERLLYDIVLCIEASVCKTGCNPFCDIYI